MSKYKNYVRLPLFLLLGFLVLVPLANTQDSKPLVKIERLKAELESQSNAISNGRNSWEAGFNGSQQMNVQQYPSSTTCVVVYGDGKYFIEKRDARNPARPKAKLASGVLSADDLEHLKAMLDDEAFKKITMPKDLVVPDDAAGLTEAERLDVQVNRGANLQQFTFMKERLKRGPGPSGSTSGSLSGMDIFLDNGEPYKKTVTPLMKWSDDLGKKNKFEEAKPQYCQ